MKRDLSFVSSIIISAKFKEVNKSVFNCPLSGLNRQVEKQEVSTTIKLQGIISLSSLIGSPFRCTNSENY